MTRFPVKPSDLLVSELSVDLTHPEGGSLCSSLVGRPELIPVSIA